MLNNSMNGQLQFLDYLNIASFCIGLMNLEENMTQGDKQELLDELTKQTKTLLGEMHAHLEEQNRKIDMILAKLEADKNDS